jgi:hypothetical protein
MSEQEDNQSPSGTSGNPDADPSTGEVMAAKVFRAVGDLRAELSLSEESFRLLTPQAHPSAREFVIFEALDELQKLAMACLQCYEHTSGEDADAGQTVTRLAAEGVGEWMSLTQRKLIETLADLIGLAETDGDLYFRDYLLLAQLDAMLGEQQDLRTYYGAESLNVRHQMERISREISLLESEGLRPEAAFYRYQKADFDLDRVRPGKVLASFSRRLEHSLGLADDNEKAGLGLSYGAGFGRASSDLHARPGPIDIAATIEDARGSIAIAITIGLSVLLRCQQIVGAVPEGENKQLKEILEGNAGATQLLQGRMRARAIVGDIVMAAGHLAQVLEVAVGRFGYESYRVRYLSRPLLPEIPEDWHRAQHVTLVADLPRMREMVKAQAEERPGEGIERLLELDDDSIRDAIAKSAGAIDKVTDGALTAAIFDQGRQRNPDGD